jgi:NAD(P)H-dependent flavin oxidoreductase YrpB (nitropropane dioxygenase family)
MGIATSFTELVGCVIPIKMAGMGVATPALAAGVAKAGALGTVSYSYLGGPKRAISTLDELVDNAGRGAIAVNFLMPALDMALLDIAAARARVVDLFWGDPDREIVERVHEGGALASWQVGSLDEARRAADCGVDVVVAQGTEAGGHVRGQTPLFELLVDVLEALEGEVPVLASGGIGTGRQIAAALGAGAAGVNVGTRLVATAESGAHSDYVQALVLAKSAEDSVSTTEFSIDCPLCPSTHRVLRSALEAARAHGDEVVGTVTMRGQSQDLPLFAGVPPTPAVNGRVDAMALYAGRGVAYCAAGQTAAEVIQELSRETERIVRRSSTRLTPSD